MPSQFCYESVNGSCEKSQLLANVRVPMYTYMVCTILTTVAGNMAVIISIAHFKQLHNPTNYLILSMSMVDLLLASVVMPFSMVRSAEQCWYFGDLFCKVHTSMDIMLSTASIFHLSFIAIDRYYAVCDPLHYRRKINTLVILTMICLSWGISAAYAFTIVFLKLNLKGSEQFFNDHISCVGGCFVFFNKTTGVTSSLLSFYIPGCIMVSIYTKIYFIARRQARSITNATYQFQIGLWEKQQMSRIRERKAAKTLGIVMGVFFCCWSPFFFCTTADPFLNYSIPPILIDALVWIGYLNSMLNPMVYAFFYRWFRRALKLILVGKVFQLESSRTILYTD